MAGLFQFFALNLSSPVGTKLDKVTCCLPRRNARDNALWHLAPAIANARLRTLARSVLAGNAKERFRNVCRARTRLCPSCQLAAPLFFRSSARFLSVSSAGSLFLVILSTILYNSSCPLAARPLPSGGAELIGARQRLQARSAS